MTGVGDAVRWGLVAAAAAWPFLVEAPTAHRRGVEVCVLVLAGLALTPTAGWLRSLALHVPACMAAGALAATALLRVQGLPVALLGACAAGAAVGGLVITAGRRTLLLPAVGLTASALLAGLVLPWLRPGPVTAPVLVVDLSVDRTLYLAALGLAVAVWAGLRNLSGAPPGWRMRSVGMAPSVAARSGVDVRATWRAGFLLSGAVAGVAGVVLALLHLGLPPAGEVGPARALALLAIPLVGGLREPEGAVLGALLLWLGTLALASAGVAEPELAAGGLLAGAALLRPGAGLADLRGLPRLRRRLVP